METKRLYYENCHLDAFSAQVLSCREEQGRWAVTLDQTAFYPEGGGQGADTGTLGPAQVLYTREEQGQVVHLCDRPLEPGSTVTGQIHWLARFDRMQQHTGEHILSGLIHQTWGWHNVGFHMGEDVVTIDFDGVVPAQVLGELERQVNEAIWKDIPLKIWTPDPEELQTLTYRSKRQLPWPVRIVQVPGYDTCACCGVHVARTGEVGLIKLLSVVNFRGGSRLELLCGRKALEFLSENYRQNLLVSRAFSAKLTETGQAAEEINRMLGQQKGIIRDLQIQHFQTLAAQCTGKGDVLLFPEPLDSALVRTLADLVADTCGGMVGVFSGTDGEGYRYCLMGRHTDLRPIGKAMTQALGGKGGGKAEFQQGSVPASREAILEHFSSFLVIV